MPKLIKKLPAITLICIDCVNHGAAIAALKKSLCEIAPKRTVFITDRDFKINGIEVVQIQKIISKQEYSAFVVRELYKYFDTPFVLIVQHDGYVLDGEAWDDTFFIYDYIAPTWTYTDGRNVGCGGFSVRSKKLQEILASDHLIEITSPEDEITARLYRHYLETEYGIEFPPDAIANRFGFELNEPLCRTFGFHGTFWPPFQEVVVVKRIASLGDVIMAEPLLEYYYKKGFKVVLDTLPEFQQLYAQHYFEVVNRAHLNPKMPFAKEINLDMAYEAFPKQPVLQSYYQVAGITDGEMRNSKLNLNSGGKEKLFKKYAVIHIDDTGMPYRNQHWIEWKYVTVYLKAQGFEVFQIGKRGHEDVATYFNTMDIGFMMFFLKGASLFIGLDSGPAQIAVAFGVPSVIFFGSVDPKLRYFDFEKIRIVQSECPKEETKNCYHNSISTTGQECVYDKEVPPCTRYTSFQVIEAIKELI